MVSPGTFYEQLFMENLFMKTTQRNEYFFCEQNLGYCIVVKHGAIATYDIHLVLFLIDFFS